MNRWYRSLALILLGLAGCLHPQTRAQSDDETETDKAMQIKTIGDLTSFGNAEGIPVSGVGVVENLNGTGGGTPPGQARKFMENELRRQGITDTKEILDSPDNALVLVSGMIPAGARKGERFDVEVTLPQGSKVTSLRGGRLKRCFLVDYDSTQHLVPGTAQNDRLLPGHQVAIAAGPLMVGFGSGDNADQLRTARIWGGARSRIERPFFLVIREELQSARVAMKLAERINETFQGTYQANGKLADAKTKALVYLRVPEPYRQNIPRFMRVVRLIPYLETPKAGSPYVQHLSEQLLNPARTVTASLRLEALGPDTVPLLKRGLQSERILVRFTSAEALAYLGSPSCGEELAKLAQDQPALRAYCLAAMASLNEAVCHVKLQELLTSTSDQTRYGAFRALRVLEEGERSSSVPGELLNNSFWVHRVAPGSSSLVAMSGSRRPEIVLFGEAAYLQPPFAFLAGPEFTITASAEDQTCLVSRISLEGTKRQKCSLKLEEVIRCMAEQGGTYPDAVELLRQADRSKCLNCAVALDPLPSATSIYQLAQAGKNPDQQSLDEEILSARADFSAPPNLFQPSPGIRPRHEEKATSSGMVSNWGKEK